MENEIEKLERDLINTKVKMYKRNRSIDFIQTIIFTWTIGFLILYVEWYAQEGTNEPFIGNRIYIILGLTISLVIWIIRNNSRVTMYYRRTLELEK